MKVYLASNIVGLAGIESSVNNHFPINAVVGESLSVGESVRADLNSSYFGWRLMALEKIENSAGSR